MEKKTFPAFVTKVNEEQGIIEAVFAVFGNVDQGDDIVHPGAFSKTFMERGQKVRVLDNHRADSIMSVIGKPISLREVSREMLPPQILEKSPEATGGAFAQIQMLMETPEGKGAFIRLKSGAVDEWSFGYDPLDFDYSKVTQGGEEITVRNLRTVKLYEISPVLWAMNSATGTTGAKSQPTESKPWATFPIGNEFCVFMVDEDGNRTGDSLGCHATEEEAQQQVEALYANVPEGQRGKAGPYLCECLDCGYEAEFDEHCMDVKCPECGGEMRRAERPGGGKEEVKFTGSPRNPYGTHASRGYPGGRTAWKRAWRIHMSGVRDQGAIQGTVRRVSMIAAGMKPKCNLPAMSSEDLGPRDGPCGKLEGDYKETPGDYGLSRWKDPSDDGLEQEDIQLTCQDLEDIKHICLQEIAKRIACEEEGKSYGESDEVKEGRVLSTANANRIATAVEALINVLEAAGIDISSDEKGKVYPTQNKTVNLGQLLRDVTMGFYTQYPDIHEQHQHVVYWVDQIWDEHIIVKQEGTEGNRLWQIPFRAGEQGIVFAPKQEWTEGAMVFVPFAVLGPNMAGPPQVVTYNLNVQMETAAPTSTEVGPQEGDAAPTDEQMRLTEIERERINIAMEV